jgi:hypothetical protein
MKTLSGLSASSPAARLKSPKPALGIASAVVNFRSELGSSAPTLLLVSPLLKQRVHEHH